MRDYGIVSPRFWIGETGKNLRGDPESQLLALYLMTSPHSTMTGVFHCPVLYMAHETGLSMEGASKALARLSEVGFCEYDEASETVFVVRMAAYQIGDTLKARDKRVIGLRREIERMAETRMKSRFLAVYGVAYNLVDKGDVASPFQAPSKPHRSQEQEQDQEQEQGETPLTPLPGGESSKPKRERKPRIALKTFIERCVEAGEKPISEYRPLLEYVEATGLPMEFVQLCWQQFKREFLPPGSKAARLQADWRRHFLNFVEKGYFKLWYARPDGTFDLTTQGVQAKALHGQREVA